MHIAEFLTVFAFFLSIATGLFVLFRSPKALANRIFSVYCLVNSWWYLTTAFQLAAPDQKSAEQWFVAGLYAALLVVALFPHFFLALIDTSLLRRHPWLAPLLYCPSVFFIYKEASAGVFSVNVVQTPIGWANLQDMSSPWTLAVYINTFSYTIGILFLLIRWAKKVGDLIHRKQARLVIISVSIGLGMYALLSGLASLPNLSWLGAISHLITLVWLVGIAYAIVRYRLMAISPAEAAYSIFTTMADGVLLLDRNGIVVNANPACYEILRLSERDLLQQPVDEALPGVFTGRSIPLSYDAAVRDQETVVTVLNGQEVYVSFSASLVKGNEGDQNGTVLVFRDITERKQTEKRLQHMATHDVLTNLPNRVLLNDRLRHAIYHADRHQDVVAVLLVDVDKFKDINDEYGHDTGDRVLIQVAQRLTASVREYDTVSRLGGDEFVIVLTELKGSQDCDAVLKRVRNAFAKPLAFDHFDLPITLSIGVSLYPTHADNIEDLYKFADMALYRVKASGRNDLQFYAPADDEATRRKSLIEQDLRGAIAHSEFELYYQPICDIVSRKLLAMETLIRWNHDKLGIVNPLEFIPYAERSGLIIPLGEWIFRQVCSQLAVWDTRDIHIPITVNLSAKQFQDPDLIDKIKGNIAEFHVDSHLLEFELTESTAIEDIDKALAIVKKLKLLGIGIVIDDFGSGYSSMTWLKYLEAKAVKIDRFFIQNLAHNSADAAIVKAIVSLAHSMGMMVIAEGIETEEQLNAIRSIPWDTSADYSCDLAQGYLFSKPVKPDIVEQLIRDSGRSASPFR